MIIARAFAAAATALLSPAKCASCDEPMAHEVVFCAACIATVERVDDDYEGDGVEDDGVIAPLFYGGAVSTAITRFKYSDRADLARPLAAILCSALALADACEEEHARGSYTVVVPVPLHPVRLAARKYNQSALLAGRVAGHLGVAFGPRALDRVRDTPAQASLDRKGRTSNLSGAFVVRQPRLVDGARVLLIDDVLTTGATLSECRAVLLAGGAASVTAAVIARVAGERGMRPPARSMMAG